jgi:uncharacterized protein with von Willebrand factor type A (vWA) domain
VFEDANFRKPVTLADLTSKSDRDEKLVIVGDASMHPAELLQAGGSVYYSTRTRMTGFEWMKLLAEHFRKSIWLNPEPESYWGQATIKMLRGLFAMYPLTIDGLERGVRYLVRGGQFPSP